MMAEGEHVVCWCCGWTTGPKAIQSEWKELKDVGTFCPECWEDTIKPVCQQILREVANRVHGFLEGEGYVDLPDEVRQLILAMMENND